MSVYCKAACRKKVCVPSGTLYHREIEQQRALFLSITHVRNQAYNCTLGGNGSHYSKASSLHDQPSHSTLDSRLAKWALTLSALMFSKLLMCQPICLLCLTLYLSWACHIMIKVGTSAKYLTWQWVVHESSTKPSLDCWIDSQDLVWQMKYNHSLRAQNCSELKGLTWSSMVGALSQTQYPDQNVHHLYLQAVSYSWILLLG